VINENRGLNPHIEDVAPLALANFIASRPDVVPARRLSERRGQGARPVARLDQAKTRQDIRRGALSAGRRRHRKPGAIGFAGGGMVNCDALARSRRGGAVLRACTRAGERRRDPGAAPARLRRQRRLRQQHLAAVRDRAAGGKRYEAQRYPGTQHGFHNDTTPRYDANVAAQAWQRALDFLNRNLRG
jgi:carboxymethylenebutenolidase